MNTNTNELIFFELVETRKNKIIKLQQINICLLQVKKAHKKQKTNNNMCFNSIFLRNVNIMPRPNKRKYPEIIEMPTKLCPLIALSLPILFKKKLDMENSQNKKSKIKNNK